MSLTTGAQLSCAPVKIIDLIFVCGYRPPNMKPHPDRTFVHNRHLQKGIDRYEGKPDTALQAILDRSDWQYTAYRFNDDRILLVYENELFGILYKNEAALHQHLEEPE